MNLLKSATFLYMGPSRLWLKLGGGGGGWRWHLKCKASFSLLRPKKKRGGFIESKGPSTCSWINCIGSSPRMMITYFLAYDKVLSCAFMVINLICCARRYQNGRPDSMPPCLVISLVLFWDCSHFETLPYTYPKLQALVSFTPSLHTFFQFVKFGIHLFLYMDYVARVFWAQ
jgi:hypothetical protein